MQSLRKPTHPGLFFKKEILEARNISVTDAAKALGVTRKSLSLFINGRVNCTCGMARRIAVSTGTEVAFWFNMQTQLDIWKAENLILRSEVTPLPTGKA